MACPPGCHHRLPCSIPSDNNELIKMVEEAAQKHITEQDSSCSRVDFIAGANIIIDSALAEANEMLLNTEKMLDSANEQFNSDRKRLESQLTEANKRIESFKYVINSFASNIHKIAEIVGFNGEESDELVDFIKSKLASANERIEFHKSISETANYNKEQMRIKLQSARLEIEELRNGKK